MNAEDKKKMNFARKVSWQQVKRALKLLFERRLEAEITDMQFMDAAWPSAFLCLTVMYVESTSSSEFSSKWSTLRWKEDQSSVEVKSWIDLASTLEAGAREGKSFTIGQKTVFGPRDSIERALVEADLLCGR